MNRKIICILGTLLISSCSENIPVISNNQPTTEKINTVEINNNKNITDIKEEEEVAAPVAKIIPERKNYTFETYTDNYSWMKNKSSSELINYLAQENKYADSILNKNTDLSNQLFDEMLNKLSPEADSIAEKNGNFYYYQKNPEGYQYPIYYRKNASGYNQEEVILDLNNFSEGKNISKPGDFKVSPDNKYVAFSIDKDGNESYKIYIMNLNTREILNEQIDNTYGNIEWTNDSKYIYYSSLNSSLRPFKIYKHKISSPVNSDKLIYHEKDNAYNLNISKSDSKAYILINSESINSNEIRYLGAKSTNSTFQVFQKRKNGIKYYIQHNGGKFYVLTNSNAKEYKVMSVNVLEQYRNVSWEQVIPATYNSTLNSFQMLKNYIIISFRQNGVPKIKAYNLKTNKYFDIDFNEPSYSVSVLPVIDFNADKINYSYSSFITPQSTYQYDLSKKTKTVLREERIRGFNSYNYQTEKLNITSRDGKKIPVSLIYKRDFVRNGNSPLLINVYGAYGLSTDPTFELDKFSLIDKGYIYAIAHVRGGGENGINWYEAGKLLNKKNSINDFIDCVDGLVYQGYTSKDKVNVFGKGAGAMTVAAAINIRPDLFENVILEEPFLDVLNTMKDERLPLTIDEYNEWGNPNNYRYYEYIKSYSPYDNIKNQTYPNILISSGLNNSVVGIWESSKYVAKVRNISKNTNILLKTYTDSGHKGRIGRFDYLKRKSLEYSYLLRN